MSVRTVALAASSAGVMAIASLAAVVIARSPGTTHTQAAETTNQPHARGSRVMAADATSPTITAAAIEQALTQAQKAPYTLTATMVDSSGNATERDVIVALPSGQSSDITYDGNGGPLYSQGLTSDRSPVYVDYARKAYYTAVGTLPAMTTNWLISGLAVGKLQISGTSVTGKDQVGSPIAITLDPSTLLPVKVVTTEPSSVVSQQYDWAASAPSVSVATAAMEAAVVIKVPAGFSREAAEPNSTGVGNG